ncbi:hypothetical protein ACFLR4_01100 [Bacteroidota bacterium]
MKAVSDNSFIVEGYDWFRVKFKIETGQVLGMGEFRSDGGVTKIKKN